MRPDGRVPKIAKMRVVDGIKLLKGAVRYAVYDTARGICWPASDDEVAILQRLARAHHAEASAASMVTMRQKGWLERGAPVTRTLELEPSRLPRKPSALDHVWLEVTNSCNLRCAHCYASSGPDVDRTDELSHEQWKIIVDDAIKNGARKITFIGGEPTIRIDLVDSLATHIRFQSPETILRMFSNLSIGRLRAQTLDVVARNHIQFGTALYGMTGQSHDSMTGRIGSWEATLAAIKDCQDRSIDIFVGMYVDLTGQVTVEDCESWLKGLGVTQYQVLAPSKVGRGEKRVWQLSETLNRLPQPMFFVGRQLEVGQIAHNCYYDHVAILPDGNAVPCIMTRKVSYGNVLHSGFGDLFSSSTFETMSALSKDNIDGCRDCEFRYACFDCRPDAMAGTDQLDRKPDCGYDPRERIDAPLVIS